MLRFNLYNYSPIIIRSTPMSASTQAPYVKGVLLRWRSITNLPVFIKMTFVYRKLAGVRQVFVIVQGNVSARAVIYGAGTGASLYPRIEFVLTCLTNRPRPRLYSGLISESTCSLGIVSCLLCRQSLRTGRTMPSPN